MAHLMSLVPRRRDRAQGRIHRTILLSFVSVAILLSAPATVLAANATATWDANPEPDIAGYKLSYGTQSGIYTTTIDVGKVTTRVVTGLTEGQRYYFSIQAYNTAGVNSVFAPEVIYDVPAATTSPSITNLSPASGSAGTPVTISGTNFAATKGTSTVTFNGTIAATTSWSATSITATVPAGATTGSVVVTVGAVPSAGVLFTVLSSPTVTGISPSTFGTSGNVPVTITGTNFLGAPSVRIGGVAATSVVRVNSTTITAVAPAHAAGVVSVVVTNPDGASATLLNGVTYTACSFSITPTSATFSAAGGTGSISVSTTAGCSWNASNGGASWITFPSGNSGTGSGGVGFSVAANSGTSTRTASLTVGGKTFGVTQSASVVTADAVVPNAGTGASQTFALTYSDGAGATNLSVAWVWFVSTFTAPAANSCMTYYQRATNSLFLLNDAGTAWLPATVGATGTLQNSQCTIALGGSTTVNLNANTLTLNLAVTFAGKFAGAKNVYLYAANAGGMASDWQTRGSWNVPGSTQSVTADAVTPASGGGLSQTFALQYSDGAGATNLSTAWVWFVSTFTAPAANSCMTHYQRGTNMLLLLNDAGTAWLSAPIGAVGTLQNSQCTIFMGSSTTVVLSGSTLTLNLALTFAPAFAGAKNVYLFAANAGGATSDWQTRGSWNVPGSTQAVTADAVSPASGSGSSQTFALKYSDTAGATNLSTAWVWFVPTMTASAANSCLTYYQRQTNTLFLINDAGTAWLSAALGGAGTLQNSQCAIALGASTTATLSATTLTLNLAVTFAPSFSGSKNIYLFAANAGGANSSWQTRGSWIVP